MDELTQRRKTGPSTRTNGRDQAQGTPGRAPRGACTPRGRQAPRPAVRRLRPGCQPRRLPIAVQAPWGISPALLPEIPLPTKIRTAFQAPVELGFDPERAEDDEYVQAKYREVCDSLQAGMDALARRRRLPLFG